MALLRNLEQSLSGLVEGTVGRVFRTEVRPTEIARKLAREMEINKRVSLSRTYAPTDYIVYLSPEDRARYAGVETSIAEELGAYLLEHARRERLVLVRRPLVEFRTDQRLRLGEFGIEARTAPISAEEAPPRHEPGPARDAEARPEAAAQVAPQAQPAAAPLEDAPYADPYAGDPFGGDDVAQPEDFVDHFDDAYPDPDPDPDPDPEPEPAPAARRQPEPPAPHQDDWLDPVDDWEAPERAEAAAPPVPQLPVPPVPAPRAAPSSVDAPWIEPRRPAAPAPLATPWIDPQRSSDPPRPPAAAPPPVAQPPRAAPLTIAIDGAVHQITGDLAVIGRSRKSDIVVSDPSVSRAHCELRRDGQGWVAIELGSTNGTLVDGQPLTTPRRLSPGSRIEVGHASAVIEVR